MVMNNHPERFTRAINKLVNAFLNGNLRAGYCNACAVGNMCNGNNDWQYAFITSRGKQYKHYRNPDVPEIDIEVARKAIEPTGYSFDELARVENAFEQSGITQKQAEEPRYYDDWNSMEDQYTRLMAVVDVLMDIDDINQEEEQSIKDKFAYA